jgi:hypothetical protein
VQHDLVAPRATRAGAFDDIEVFVVTRLGRGGALDHE